METIKEAVRKGYKGKCYSAQMHCVKHHALLAAISLIRLCCKPTICLYGPGLAKTLWCETPQLTRFDFHCLLLLLLLFYLFLSLSPSAIPLPLLIDPQLNLDRSKLFIAGFFACLCCDQGM